jgi:acetolactate synthase I/II/III large subunit
MKASDLFVKALENEGVEYIFGIPGEENLDMLESLREAGIKLVVTRHEQGAGFMAATVGRLTGKVGVCISTLGPGATNFTTPAAYAQLGGFPMMMVTGQKPIKKSKQGQFQIIDVVSMMKPLTKYTKQIVHGNTIPALMRDAVSIAEDERPGAVHFELPEDIAREETDAELMTVVEAATPEPDLVAVQEAAALIKAAKHPVLIVASGCNRKENVPEAATAFVDTTGMYFLNSQMGKGVIDERHEKFLGTAALSSKDSVHCAIDRADLVIVVGHDPIEKPPFIMSKDHRHGGASGPEVLHINYFQAAVDQVYFPQHQLIGDIGAAFEMLAQELEGVNWDCQYNESVRQKYLDYVAKAASDESFPMVPGRIVADMRKLTPEDGILCLDNGMYKLWFARHYPAYQRNTILLDNALATMGAGLPSAIAAKLVYPDRKVVAVCGDGGFMMNSQEIETAVRLGLDLVVLILNDNGYQMIKWKQGDMGFADFGLDFANPDFVKYAETYGATGHRVESLAGFEETVKKAQEAGGVHIIDVPIDYSVNKELSAPTLMDKGCPAWCGC